MRTQNKQYRGKVWRVKTQKQPSLNNGMLSILTSLDMFYAWLMIIYLHMPHLLTTLTVKKKLKMI